MMSWIRPLALAAAIALAALPVSAKRAAPPEAAPTTPPAYVTHLAAYDFDDGLGGPDAQGWTTVDLSVQADTFSHVDDFSGLEPDFSPIEGAKSFWVGTRPSPELCDYATLPGYGNNWDESFESVPFTTSGDVTISYYVRYDTEPGYDYFRAQYFSRTGTRHTLAEYNGPISSPGAATEFASHTIPADSLDGTARFLFQFTSDGGFSDQFGLYPSDGAAFLDSITVSDDTGVIDYQDFESEAVDDRNTADGHWHSGHSAYFGNYGGLMDGTGVLQEDSVTINTSYLWGFFNGSTDSYACGGHPGQASVPLAPAVDSDPRVYFSCGIESPIIDVRQDLDGYPVPGPPDQLVIGFDVYVDAVPDNEVYYNVAVRRFYDGCLSTFWEDLNPINTGPNKSWHREQTGILLFPSVTHVQIRLSAYEAGRSLGQAHTCNSHAPLFDNVTVDGYFNSVTDARETPSAGYALHANVPNPFNPTTHIAFDVPGGGGDVRLAVYDVSGRRVAVLSDGHREGGTHTVDWDGRGASGQPAASGVYFYRLEAPGVSLSRKMVLLK